MKNEELYEVLSDIDEDYVNQARQTAQKKPKSAWRRWVPLAACLGLLVVALGILWASHFEGQPSLGSTTAGYTSNPTTFSTVPPASATNSTTSDPKYVTIHADWPQYATVPALVDAVTEVFTGKVIDISFKVLDEKTLQVVNAPVEDAQVLLYTIYEIEVMDTYKGNSVERQYIAIGGGIPGYNVSAQIQALKDCGVYDKNPYIPMMAEHRAFELGVEYLFAASDLGVGYLLIPNPEQCAFAVEEDSAGTDAMMPTYESIIRYFETQE